MCGRFFLESSIDDIFKYYGISINERVSLEPGEKFPGDKVPIVIGGKELKLQCIKWGFKMFNIKEIINARIETINQKRSFKWILQTKRCIVPANAFYEWCGEGRNKIRYKIEVEDSPLFSMAALYNSFINEKNETYNGFVILTKPANTKMEEIHKRMPVILNKFQEKEWLGRLQYSETSLNRLVDENLEQKLKAESVDSLVQLNLFNRI